MNIISTSYSFLLLISVYQFSYAQDENLEIKFINAASKLDQFLESQGDLINGNVEGYWMGKGYFESANENILSLRGFRLKYNLIFKITQTDWIRIKLRFVKKTDEFILLANSVRIVPPISVC